MTKEEKIKGVTDQLNQVSQQLLARSPEAQRLIGQLEGLREDELESTDEEAKED